MDYNLSCKFNIKTQNQKIPEENQCQTSAAKSICNLSSVMKNTWEIMTQTWNFTVLYCSFWLFSGALKVFFHFPFNWCRNSIQQFFIVFILFYLQFNFFLLVRLSFTTGEKRFPFNFFQEIFRSFITVLHPQAFGWKG